MEFQHTATRRWLLSKFSDIFNKKKISTHSHPKVAAPYIKKQEKSVDYFLYFANLFQNREWDKYNGHVVVIQMN